jgi:disulfide bond formation protein DsbB
MYPLALLLTIAAVRRDDGIRLYARVLAGLGLLVSAYHVGVQRIPALSGTSSCPADASCTVQWVDVFGLSIPAMAACGFIGVLALLSLPRPGTDDVVAEQTTTGADAERATTPA